MTADEYTNFKYKSNAELAAMMAMADINVLNMATTDTVEFQDVPDRGANCERPGEVIVAVVEYKWWYGPAPSDSRWQRVPVVYGDFTCNSFSQRERQLCEKIICTVAEIREHIEKQTGVSQSVRH